METGYLKLKRILDPALAFILLILLWPLMLIIAVAIRLHDPGPAIFRQKRPGYKARPFYIYKFRTMSIKSRRIVNGRSEIIPDHERITPLGGFLRRTSLDELPQLFNIVTGRMSFIGPRPLLMSYLSRYSTEQARRHDVMPGISGLAQVSGRNAIPWEDKFKLDIYYVDNVSLALDIKVLFLTLKNVIKRTGVNSSENETMPVFKGRG